jgi:hypothetical protein
VTDNPATTDEWERRWARERAEPWQATEGGGVEDGGGKEESGSSAQGLPRRAVVKQRVATSPKVRTAKPERRERQKRAAMKPPKMPDRERDFKTVGNDVRSL